MKVFRGSDDVSPLMLIRRCGWVLPAYVGLQSFRGLVPAGFLWLMAIIVSQHTLSTVVLLVCLATLLAVGELIDALEPPIRAHVRDRARIVVEGIFLEVVAAWPDLSLHEAPRLIRLRADAERSIGAIAEAVIFLGFLGVSVFALGPTIVLAASVNIALPLCVLLGALPLSIGIARLYQDVWDTRSAKLDQVLRIEGFSDVASRPAFAKDLRTFHMREWIVGRWWSGQDVLLNEVGELRAAAGKRLVAWSVLSAAVSLLGVLFAVRSSVETALALVVTIGLFIQVRSSLDLFVQAGLEMSALRGPLRNYLEFVNATDEAVDQVSPVDHPSGALDVITVHGLVFSYPSAEGRALDSVSFEIPKNGITAIVGPNGAGKSTLVKVLCGLYKPQSGSIRGWPSGKCAVMQQDVARMPLTVRENLECGVEVGPPELWQVLHVVGLADKVMSLKAGLDTPLYMDGDGVGSDLSGGEWQRLALARTLLRATRTDVVILDEPTSALDAFSEADMLNRATTFLFGRTVVLVTHRLNFAKNADHIVLVRGPDRLFEGSHQALMERDCWYREAFMKQSAAFVEQ